MLRLTGVARLALVLSATAALAGAASVHGAADPAVTVRYAGTLDTSADPIMKLPDGRNSQRASYRWALTWRGRLSQLAKSPTQSFTVESLSGTVSYVDRTSAEKADCTGTYVAKVKKITFTASYDAAGGTIGFNVRVPVSSEFLRPTNTTSLHEFCSEVQRWAIPGNDLIPFFQVSAEKGGSASHNVRVPPQGSSRDRGDLVQSLIVRVAGQGGSSGVDVKALARADLRQAVERAKGPCLHLAISLGVLTTGAVWTSVGAPVPGGIPAGGAVIATGDVMASAVAPLCAELVRQIVVDYSIVKRDPPLPPARALRLPACTKWQGKVRAYCQELETAVTRLASAEHRVVGVVTRLQAAAGRLAAARRAGDASAASAAEQTVSSLAGALESARRAARVEGKRVASVIARAGVQGKLTAAQSSASTNALLAVLAKRGVPAAGLRALAPAALGPGPVDVLATLAR
jgi:hypothetical protein